MKAKDVDILYDLQKDVNLVPSHVDKQSPSLNNYPQLYPQLWKTMWIRESYPRDALPSYQKRNLDDNGTFCTYPHRKQYAIGSMHRDVDCG
jgi:hypothetical protein